MAEAVPVVVVPQFLRHVLDGLAQVPGSGLQVRQQGTLQIPFGESAQVRIVGVPRDVGQVVQGREQVHMGKAADARDEHEVKPILKVLEQAEELAQDRDKRLGIDVPAQQVGERRIVLVDQNHGSSIELSFELTQQ